MSLLGGFKRIIDEAQAELTTKSVIQLKRLSDFKYQQETKTTATIGRPNDIMYIRMLFKGEDVSQSGRKRAVIIESPRGSFLEEEDVEVEVDNEKKGWIYAKRIKGKKTGIVVSKGDPFLFHSATKRLIEEIKSHFLDKEITVEGKIIHSCTFPVNIQKINPLPILLPGVATLKIYKEVFKNMITGQIPDLSSAAPLRQERQYLHKFIISNNSGYYAVDYLGKMPLSLTENTKITIKGRLIEDQRIIRAQNIILAGARLTENVRLPLFEEEYSGRIEKIVGKVKDISVLEYDDKPYRDWLFRKRDEITKGIIDCANEFHLETGSQEFMVPTYSIGLKKEDGENVRLIFRPVWLTENSYIENELCYWAHPFPHIDEDDNIEVEAIKDESGNYLVKSLFNRKVSIRSYSTLNSHIAPINEDEVEITGTIVTSPATYIFGIDIEKLKSPPVVVLEKIYLLKQVIFRMKIMNGNFVSALTTKDIMEGYYDYVWEKYHQPIVRMTNAKIKAKGFYRENGVFQIVEIKEISEG